MTKSTQVHSTISSGITADLTNWSKSARSSCVVFRTKNIADITQALTIARSESLSLIAHGAGHSYTDAALNTGGIVIDVTPMRQILSWDPAQGIIQVEPGVSLWDVIQTTWKDGWWPAVSPSTPHVTIGGCVAMNVNGKNAWKCGSFGEQVRAIEVLLASGEVCALTPERDTALFQAVVGGIGLLGIITSITLQLQRLSSGQVTVRRRSAASLADLLTIFAEEKPTSDFLEAWFDGFAEGNQLGRGYVTSAALSEHPNETAFRLPSPGIGDRLAVSISRWAGRVSRPTISKSIAIANRANYWWSRRSASQKQYQRALLPYTYWPAAAFAGYHTLFAEGIETFQAFVPRQFSREVFERALRYSQQRGCMPLWCIIKEHRRDPFLLSYQVDGFSLELDYQRTHQTAQHLEQVLRYMIALVIDAGGRFYLAKDHFLTHAQYRQSVGDEVINAFLQLKQRCDPDTVWQSDLFRRLFQPVLS